MCIRIPYLKFRYKISDSHTHNWLVSWWSILPLIKDPLSILSSDFIIASLPFTDSGVHILAHQFYYNTKFTIQIVIFSISSQNKSSLLKPFIFCILTATCNLSAIFFSFFSPVFLQIPIAIERNGWGLLTQWNLGHFGGNTNPECDLHNCTVPLICYS